MPCIQMYYVCVFIGIIGQTGHYLCQVYKCTMCVASLTYTGQTRHYQCPVYKCTIYVSIDIHRTEGVLTIICIQLYYVCLH